ncbi:Disintegrin And Metalloproteinase Domain-Containing Protein 29 [Manis pentadactyla]|nr:Disintegrin And Metalloproteinase Domain-Containing Protein 29 [Manis pentadactyla]
MAGNLTGITGQRASLRSRSLLRPSALRPALRHSPHRGWVPPSASSPAGPRAPAAAPPPRRPPAPPSASPALILPEYLRRQRQEGESWPRAGAGAPLAGAPGGSAKKGKETDQVGNCIHFKADTEGPQLSAVVLQTPPDDRLWWRRALWEVKSLRRDLRRDAGTTKCAAVK